MSVQKATDNNTQLHNIGHVYKGRPEKDDNKNRSLLDEGYWDGLGEQVRLNTKKEETSVSKVVEITFVKKIKQLLVTQNDHLPTTK